MTFEEFKKDFSNMMNGLVKGNGVEVQINKIIQHLREKYNEDFILISYGDRYDKLDDDITILAYPADNPKTVFKASRK